MSFPLRYTKLLLPMSLAIGCLALGVLSHPGDWGRPSATGQAGNGRVARAETLTAAPASATTGQTLYQRWCESCHGAQGDGTGTGARYVYPPPRNLLSGRFSLVSSENRIVSRTDIERVLRNGMPGTAMVAYENKVREDELKALVDEVCRLCEVGAAARYAANCDRTGEAPDEEQRREFVARYTTPSAALVVPSFSVHDRRAVERGKLLFHSQGCSSCHGSDGVGATDVALIDETDHAVRPRDLVHEPFKGGHQPEAIYRRIHVGFPSGPMPAHTALSEQQTVDLVCYVVSLSAAPKRVLTNWQLRRYATRGLYRSEFPVHTVP
jgi:mono/diheme cytochrome c family protein